MIPNRRRASASKLFAVYAVASLLPVCALGVVLGRGYAQAGLEQARQQGLAQAAVIEQMALAPAMTGTKITAGLTSVERDRIQAATDLAIFSGSVTHLRLRTFDGRVAFSDDGKIAGVLPAADPAFRSAVKGRASARVVSVDGAPTIRVLQPVIASANGQSIGVLEVHLPYDTIAAKVRDDTNQTIVRLGVSLLGLYALLALISYLTTRALRRQAEVHEHDALHDPLTGLANRELFRRAAQQLVVNDAKSPRGALVLLDLDHFKQVNDSLGHHAGDELLRVVAQRLKDSLRTDDVVARLGGDEFGLILPGVAADKEALALLGTVQERLAEVVRVSGNEICVEASFGVCFYPDGAASVEDLMQRADQAMYEGKRGTDGIVVYSPRTTRAHTSHSLVIQRELREALGKDELTLYYQPKVDLQTEARRGVEALVRWRHPTRGLLPPAEFLAVAEHSGLIRPLTAWVLDRALDDYLAWTRLGSPWKLSVNISARNLDTMDFVSEVCGKLSARSIDPGALLLEVTETALATDADMAMAVVNALASRGVGTSIDDFGVGYTSLSQMRDLAVAEIKIDRSLVSGLAVHERDRSIVAAMIDLGHRLGCQVTAEGVEDQDVATWLLRAGCDLAQGYLWSQPRPWRELLRPANTDDTAHEPHGHDVPDSSVTNEGAFT